MLVFIDESGDPGFKLTKGSSSHFVVCMVIFDSAEAADETVACIERVATEFRHKTEFKFAKTRPELRDRYFEAVRNCQFRLRCIVVDKSRVYSKHLRNERERFYNYFVKSLLRHDNGVLRSAKVIIDGSGDRAFREELTSYLRSGDLGHAVRDVRLKNSKNDRLVQLADMSAGAVARSYKRDKPDAARWRRMIAPRVEDVWEFS